MPRLLLILFLILIGAFILRKLLLGFSSRPAPKEARILVQDPHCLVHLSAEDAIRKVEGGVTRYFCSPECAAAFATKKAEKV